jgi:hypothetical protein
MQITPIGCLLIPLAMFAFVFRPGWLYFLMIFFAPFTATSILNSGTGDSGAGLQPSIFFGFLLLARLFVNYCYALTIRVSRSQRTSVALLFAFGAACVISLAMPFAMGGRVEVLSRATLDSPTELLHFKTSNITATVAVLAGIGLACYTARRALDPAEFRKTLRTYLWSGILVSCWGLLQFVLYLVGIPYPAMVFNNSASPYALGYNKPLGELPIVRVSSVGLEPSLFATSLVGIIPIALLAVLGGDKIIGRLTDRFALALLLLTAILTTSSIGYLSLFATGCILLYMLYRSRRLSGRIVVLVCGMSVLAATLYVTVPAIQNAGQQILFDKTDSWSALERGTIVLSDYEYFRRSPILGLGWGSAPAHDLTFGILANCGLIGLGSFLVFVGYTLRKLYAGARAASAEGQLCNPQHIMLLSLTATFIAYLIGGLPGGPAFWLLIGLSMAANGQASQSRLQGRHGLLLGAAAAGQ